MVLAGNNSERRKQAQSGLRNFLYGYDVTAGHPEMPTSLLFLQLLSIDATGGFILVVLINRVNLEMLEILQLVKHYLFLRYSFSIRFITRPHGTSGFALKDLRCFFITITMLCCYGQQGQGGGGGQ